ncbi:MAG: OB-fold nucleic acid binding domain-containing protein, partial [Varibaculum cambriense]|nr:OB-fold nucleic acid binding domain-containing protein [Varibaculum cambriense]
LKETAPHFAPLTASEQVQWDSSALGISLWGYPTKLLRPELTRRGILPAEQLRPALTGKRIRCAGIVTHRQRPHTAKGVVFLSLEDETGIVNVICQVGCWQHYRRLALSQNALIVRGVLQAKDGALALLADKIEPLKLDIPTTSRNFR